MLLVILGEDIEIGESTDCSSSGEDTKNDSDSFEDMLKYYSRNKISLTCLKDAFDLIKKPTSIYKIKKAINCRSEYSVQYYIYCDRCAEYSATYSSDTKRKCCKCSISLKLLEINFFVYIPIVQQLEKMLAIYIEEIIIYAQQMEKESSSDVQDIQNGELYKSVKAKLNGNAIILPMTK